MPPFFFAQADFFTTSQLEGRLEILSVHGETPEFCIYDPITDQPVRCTFTPDSVVKAADLIKRRARVRVLGRAKYNRKHKPTALEVESFEVLRDQCDLPQIADLHKARINITGDAGSVDFVRGLRDGD